MRGANLIEISSAEDGDWLSHGGLQVEFLHVVPSFLQERNQKVDRHGQVHSEFFICHLLVSEGGTHAQNLFQLEFD